jgi:hypothetical protein
LPYIAKMPKTRVLVAVSCQNGDPWSSTQFESGLACERKTS